MWSHNVLLPPAKPLHYKIAGNFIMDIRYSVWCSVIASRAFWSQCSRLWKRIPQNGETRTRFSIQPCPIVAHFITISPVAPMSIIDQILIGSSIMDENNGVGVFAHRAFLPSPVPLRRFLAVAVRCRSLYNFRLQLRDENPANSVYNLLRLSVKQLEYDYMAYIYTV